jgi:cytochrome P450
MVADWQLMTDWRLVEDGSAANVEVVYGRPRTACPVQHSDELFGGFWAVLGHGEVVDAALDTASFSNVVPLLATRRPPLESDPPEHSIFRRLMNPYFSRDRIMTLEPIVRGFVGDMIDDALARESVDFATEITYSLPSRVLCAFLGLDDADWTLINEWEKKLAAIVGPHSTPSRSDGAAADAPAAASDVVRPYVERLVAKRRLHPMDDLVTGLVTASVDGEPLSEELIVGMVMLVITAGHNTTTSALGNSVLALARDRPLQQRLRAEPSLLPAAIEEWLRLEAPQQSMRRVATRDVELAGQPIGAGDRVELVFGAANLDPEAIESPERFSLERSTNRHLAFGRGIHSCIGAPLARLEIRVLLEELLARTRYFELNGPIQRTPWPRLGVQRLPLTLTGLVGHAG